MMRVARILMLALALVGCGQPRWHSDAPDAMPADFSLVLTVQSDEADPSRPLRMASHYVLESDRTLRVALGRGADDMTYPPPTARLTPLQVEGLYRLMREHGLLTAERATATGPVTYRIAVTANGRRRRYTTSPDASPGARALLARLIELRGGLPPQPESAIMSDSP